MKENLLNKLDKHPINCKIYTKNISVAKKLFDNLEIDWSKNFRLLEPGVGEAHIFKYIISQFLNSKYAAKLHKEELEQKILKSFFAYDVDEHSVEYTLKVVSELFSEYDLEIDFSNNIFRLNIFSEEINKLGKFDYIISNPPYISIKKLNKEQRTHMRNNYYTCQKGGFDMYYVFFEKSIEQLSENGKLSFIIPNSFLNNKSGRYLREVMLTRSNVSKIYNYPSNHMFDDAQVKTCITVLDKRKSSYSYYEDDKLVYKQCKPHIDSFILPDTKRNRGSNYETIDKYFKVVGGIATLDDNFFIISENEIVDKCSKYFTIYKFKKNYKIEKKLIKKLIKPNKNKNYFVIFPYDTKGVPILEENLIEKYPMYYKYCEDNGRRDNMYFGRTQALDLLNYDKLLIPQFWTEEVFIPGNNALVSAGIAFVPLNEKSSFKCLKNSLVKGIEENKEMFKRNSKSTYTMSTRILKKLQYIRED